MSEVDSIDYAERAESTAASSLPPAVDKPTTLVWERVKRRGRGHYEHEAKINETSYCSIYPCFFAYGGFDEYIVFFFVGDGDDKTEIGRVKILEEAKRIAEDHRASQPAPSDNAAVSSASAESELVTLGADGRTGACGQVL
jgi:hypothetical protein